jgi:hypothetical protein
MIGRRIMDTDDLTEMAYEMISIAGEISEYLRCDIGVRSRDYKNEGEYLMGIHKFLRRILSRPHSYLESWNLEDEVDPKAFKRDVASLVEHIAATLATPISERGPTPFE